MRYGAERLLCLLQGSRVLPHRRERCFWERSGQHAAAGSKRREEEREH